MALSENSDKITYDEFKELVREMRHAQRRYFISRRPEVLVRSKELERQVDEVLADARQMRLPV